MSAAPHPHMGGSRSAHSQADRVGMDGRSGARSTSCLRTLHGNTCIQGFLGSRRDYWSHLSCEQGSQTVTRCRFQES